VRRRVLCNLCVQCTRVIEDRDVVLFFTGILVEMLSNLWLDVGLFLQPEPGYIAHLLCWFGCIFSFFSLFNYVLVLQFVYFCCWFDFG